MPFDQIQLSIIEWGCRLQLKPRMVPKRPLKPITQSNTKSKVDKRVQEVVLTYEKRNLSFLPIFLNPFSAGEFSYSVMSMEMPPPIWGTGVGKHYYKLFYAKHVHKTHVEYKINRTITFHTHEVRYRILPAFPPRPSTRMTSNQKVTTSDVGKDKMTTKTLNNAWFTQVEKMNQRRLV